MTRARAQSRAPRARAATKKPPAKKNGRGGARAGAGRKADALPEESITRLGAPPLDSPLLMARWWNRILGEVGWLVALGQVKPTIVGTLRSLAGTAGRLVPDDLRAEVDRIIKEMEAAKKPESQGPKLEEHRGDQPPLRGVPR